MSTRIAVAGDLHGFHKRPALEEFLAIARPDLLLLVGDVQDYRGFAVPTVFVRGNHESWPVLETLRRGTRVVPNLRYLADGDILTIEGLSIAGIGGNWSPDDRPRPRHIPHAYLARFAQSRPDIVLSHETPNRYPERPHLCCEPLRAAAERMAPKLWFSGHHHYYTSEQIGRTSAVALGKWPHEWVTFEIERGRVGEIVRFVPPDREAYEARLAEWSQLEQLEKSILLPLDKRGEFVYGVTDAPNEHATAWFGAQSLTGGTPRRWRTP